MTEAHKTKGAAVDRNPAQCPSCERFIGTDAVCPYCDADSMRAPTWRVLRWGAGLLALIGLGFLYLMARHREPPRVQAGEVGSGMNFAYVCMQGTLPRDARVSVRGAEVEKLTFVLEDDTGSIPVSAYGKTAAAVVARVGTPARGDRILVSGNLRVGPNERVRLVVEVPAHVRILRRGDSAP